MAKQIQFCMATSLRRPDPASVVVALDRSASTSLSTQLADGLRAAALDGRLLQGDRMPSSRALAERLGVSRAVTTAAYDQLHGEGWLQTRHGAGTFLAAAPAPGASTALPVPPSRRSRRATPPATGSGRAALIPGLPLEDVLDRAAWRRAWRAAGDRMPAGYRHRDEVGEPEFRHAVAEHFVHHRGLSLADPLAADGVIATGGTAAALAEIMRVALPRGSRVAMEAPGWPRAWRILTDAGMDIVASPVDEHGLLPDQIPPDVAAVYTTPAHQFPLGGCLPAERRLRLLERAASHDWLVIEDDYDGELGADIAPPPSLTTLDPERVVYLGSMSKIVSPVLSSGWMIAPTWLTDRVLEARRRTSPPLSPTGQWIVAELAATGDLARHLRRLRRELLHRRAFTHDAFHRAGVHSTGSHAGGHVFVPFASARQATGAWRSLHATGIDVELLTASPGQHSSNGLTIGVTTGTRQQFETHIRAIATAL